MKKDIKFFAVEFLPFNEVFLLKDAIKRIKNYPYSYFNFKVFKVKNFQEIVELNKKNWKEKELNSRKSNAIIM